MVSVAWYFLILLLFALLLLTSKITKLFLIIRYVLPIFVNFNSHCASFFLLFHSYHLFFHYKYKPLFHTYIFSAIIDFACRLFPTFCAFLSLTFSASFPFYFLCKDSSSHCCSSFTIIFSSFLFNLPLIFLFPFFPLSVINHLSIFSHTLTL